MLSLGLSASRYATFLRTLSTGYEFKVTVQVLDPEHRLVRTVSHTLLDGQVDATAPKLRKGEVEVSRTCQLQFIDPGSTLALDSGSPTVGAYYMDRMIRVIYSVRCPFGWVDVPVFTGPIVKVDRDGDLVDVECQGKEYYALGSAWKTYTRKGRRGDVMTYLMRQSGEISRYMNFPDTKKTVSKEVAVGRESTLWSHVWRVNAGITAGRLLFYDGRGICQSRPKPTKTAIVLRQATGGLVAELPQISVSTSELKNAVRVVGAKGSKGKPTPYFLALPPRNHQLSPFRLGRRGEGLYRGEFVQNDELKSVAACRAVAVDLLEDHLMQQVETTLGTLPIPHLEPWDVVRVVTPHFDVRVRVNAFSLPLVQDGAGTPMQIGSTKNLRRPRRRIGRS